jgi:TatD family-associated radical SAM protein
MKKKENIVYRFETPVYPANILYVNLIGGYSCTNDCKFCGRPRTKEDIGKKNIYEKKAKSFLYLKKSPSSKRVLEEVGKAIRKDDEEIALIGLGEPLIYLSKIITITKKLKETYPKIKIRIDTNGATKEINRDPAGVVRKLEKVLLNEIRVSLNAINDQEYDLLCRPRDKNTFKTLVKFVKALNKTNIDTYVSFVVGFNEDGIKSRPKKDYIEFAKSLGINKKNVILRDYVDIN